MSTKQHERARICVCHGHWRCFSRRGLWNAIKANAAPAKMAEVVTRGVRTKNDALVQDTESSVVQVNGIVSSCVVQCMTVPVYVYVHVCVCACCVGASAYACVLICCTQRFESAVVWSGAERAQQQAREKVRRRMAAAHRRRCVVRTQTPPRTPMVSALEDQLQWAHRPRRQEHHSATVGAVSNVL